MRSPRVQFLSEWLRVAVFLQVDCVCKLPGKLVKIHALPEKISMRLNVWGCWCFRIRMLVFLGMLRLFWRMLMHLLLEPFECQVPMLLFPN